MKETEEMTVTLECCHAKEKILVNPTGIAAREPNEIKMNIICQRCGKLVILSFELKGNQTIVTEQEVIEL